MAESGDYDAFDDALASENQPNNNMYSAQDDGDIVDLYDDVMKDNISYGGYETPSAKRDEDAKNAGDKSDSMLSAPSPAGGGDKPASNGGTAKSGSISTLGDEDADDTTGPANTNNVQQAGSDAGSVTSNMPSSVHSAGGFYQHQQQQPYQRRYAFLVSNLAWWTTEDELEDAVVSLGISDIADIRVNDNRQNGQSKGFAVVVVLSEASNRAILRLTEKELNGQKPVVQVYAKHTLMELDTTNEQRNNFGGGMGGNMGGGPGRFNNPRFGGPGGMMIDRPPMAHGGMMMGGGGGGPGMMMGGGPPRPMGMGGPMGGARGPPMMMGNNGQMMMRPQMGMGGGMNRPMPPGGMMMQQPGQNMMGVRGPNAMGGVMMGPNGHRMMMGNNAMSNGGVNSMMMRPGMGGVMGVNMQMMQQPPGGNMMLNAAGPNVHINPAFLQQQQQMGANAAVGGMNPQSTLVNGGVMPMDPSQQMGGMSNSNIMAVGGDAQHGVHNAGGDFSAGGGAAAAQMNPYGDMSMMMNAGGVQQPHMQHPAQQQLHTTTTSQEPTSMSEHGDSSAMSRDEILLRNKSVSSTAISRAWADARSGDYKSAIDTLTTAISIIRRSRVADDERCKILISSLEERLTAIQKEAEDGGAGGSSTTGGGGGQVSSRSRSRSPGHRSHRSHRSRSPGYHHKRSSRRSGSRSRSPTSRDRRRSREKRSSSRDRYRSSRHRRH